MQQQARDVVGRVFSQPRDVTGVDQQAMQALAIGHLARFLADEGQQAILRLVQPAFVEQDFHLAQTGDAARLPVSGFGFELLLDVTAQFLVILVDGVTQEVKDHQGDIIGHQPANGHGKGRGQIGMQHGPHLPRTAHEQKQEQPQQQVGWSDAAHHVDQDDWIDGRQQAALDGQHHDGGRQQQGAQEPGEKTQPRMTAGRQADVDGQDEEQDEELLEGQLQFGGNRLPGDRHRIQAAFRGTLQHHVGVLEKHHVQHDFADQPPDQRIPDRAFDEHPEHGQPQHEQQRLGVQGIGEDGLQPLPEGFDDVAAAERLGGLMTDRAMGGVAALGLHAAAAEIDAAGAAGPAGRGLGMVLAVDAGHGLRCTPAGEETGIGY